MKRNLSRNLWDKFKNFAESVTTRKSPEKRKEVFSNLREAVTAVGFNVGMIREGIDIRRATNAFDLVGMGSLIDKLQSVGRIIRSWAEKPDKEANAIDMVTYINGRMRGNPIHYYEAVGDKSLLKGIIDANVDLDWILKKAAEQGIKIVEKPAKDNEQKPKKDTTTKGKESKDKDVKAEGKPNKAPVEVVEVSQIGPSGEKIPINNIIKNPKPEKPQTELIGAAENLLKAESLVFDFKKNINAIKRFTNDREEGKVKPKTDDWLAEYEWQKKLGSKSPFLSLVIKVFKENHNKYTTTENEDLEFKVKYDNNLYTVKTSIRQTATNKAFSIHQSAEPLLKNIKNQTLDDFYSTIEAAKVLDLSTKEVTERANNIKENKYYSELGLPKKVGVKGNKLVKKEFNKTYISGSLLEKWKEIEDYKNSLIDQGYLPYHETITHSYDRVKIKKEGVVTSEINDSNPVVWINPFNSMDGYASPELVKKFTEIDEYKQKLLDKGYLKYVETIDNKRIRVKIKKEGNVTSNMNLEEPNVWVNPNHKDDSYINPAFAKRYTDVAEYKQKLLDKGYLRYREAIGKSARSYLKEFAINDMNYETPKIWVDPNNYLDSYINPNFAKQVLEKGVKWVNKNIAKDNKEPTNKITNPKHDGTIQEKDIDKKK